MDDDEAREAGGTHLSKEDVDYQSNLEDEIPHGVEVGEKILQALGIDAHEVGDLPRNPLACLSFRDKTRDFSYMATMAAMHILSLADVPLRLVLKLVTEVAVKQPEVGSLPHLAVALVGERSRKVVVGMVIESLK